MIHVTETTSQLALGCPKRSLTAAHYREDRTCRCNEHAEAWAALLTARCKLRAAQANVAAAELRVEST